MKQLGAPGLPNWGQVSDLGGWTGKLANLTIGICCCGLDKNNYVFKLAIVPVEYRVIRPFRKRDPARSNRQPVCIMYTRCGDLVTQVP